MLLLLSPCLILKILFIADNISSEMLYIPLEISKKTSFHPKKFCKIVWLWHFLEIPKSKTKTHGNSIFFFEHPKKFHFFLIDCSNFLMFFLQYP